MRALSVRQPFAELILRGIKTVEYRSRPTRIVGERFYIYAAKKWAMAAAEWPVKRADNITVPGESLPQWMIELAEQTRLIEPGALLPTGVIVGSAVIEHCAPVEVPANLGVARPDDDHQPPATYAWHLANVERVKTLRKPSGRPQPVWFRPF